jgi:hypothetical protein
MSITVIFEDKKYTIDEKTCSNIKKYKFETTLSVLLENCREKTIEFKRSGLFFGELLNIYNGVSKSYCTYISKIKEHYYGNVKEDKNFKNHILELEKKYATPGELFEAYIEDLKYHGLVSSIKVDKSKYSDIFTFKIILQNKLTLLGLNKSFLNAVRDLGGIISGSFILKTYLNEDWTSNDVDIYVNLYDFSRMIAYSERKNRKTVDEKESERLIKLNLGSEDYEKTDIILVSKFLSTIFHESKISDVKVNNTEYRHNYVKKDIKIVMNGVNIDLVLCDRSPLRAIELFDFDFNKIYFDGTSLGACNWNSIHNRISGNNPFNHAGDNSDLFFQNMRRIEKYVERGFVILPQCR